MTASVSTSFILFSDSMVKENANQRERERERKKREKERERQCLSTASRRRGEFERPPIFISLIVLSLSLSH